ncbi:MAG: archease [bacterium]
MEKFRILSHTADIGIVAYGRTLGAVFTNAALGMFNIMTDIKKVKPTTSIRISVKASNSEELFVRWLNELLYYYSRKQIVFSMFEIKSIDERKLTAVVYGEKLKKSSIVIRREIKAATYHQLKLKRMVLPDNSIELQAEVIFDV